MSQGRSIPASWVQTELGDISSVIRGITFPATGKEFEKKSSNVYCLRTSNIQKEVDWSDVYYVPRSFVKRTAQMVQPGDVLMSMANSYELVGKVAVARTVPGETAFGAFLSAVRPRQGVNPQYLFHLLRTQYVQQELRSGSSQTTNIANISVGRLSTIDVPLPPAVEQERIAAKLDSVVARIDSCRERLDRVPQILKRFREAVLEAAVSGRLTEEWRAEKAIAGDWSTVKLEDVGELGRGKSKHRPRNDPRLYGGPYPFIQTGDIAQSGGRISTNDQTYSEFGVAQSKLWPCDTLCITIAANIADTAILSYPACFPDSVVGFVADSAKCSPWFIKWSVDVLRGELTAFAPATAQKNINLAVLNRIQIKLPCLEEQTEIVRRVNELLALSEGVSRRHVDAISRVERMTPSVLAKAFRGELVPQDPNDEPAEQLLMRIRARKESGEVKSAKTKGGRRVAARR